MAASLKNSETLLQADGIAVVTGGVNRLVDFSCRVPFGATAIVGESGAGKTTLLNLIAGQERAHSGQIRLSDSLRQNAVPIFWSPQTGGLWSHFTVARHIVEVLPRNQQSDAEMTKKADELLAKFDLHHRRAAFPGELSMGERSRLSIARALAVRPALLLMDEPLAHVDVSRRAVYWKLIRDHLAETKASLLFTTHEPTAAIAHSQHVLCLSAGRLVHEGSTRELYHNPPSEMAGQFLGPLNWFEPDATQTWLQRSADVPVSARAEAVGCEPDGSSPLKLVSVIDYGNFAESVVENESTNERRTIFHRPFAIGSPTPDNVRLEVNV